jgi:hypothetical protein
VRLKPIASIVVTTKSKKAAFERAVSTWATAAILRSLGPGETWTQRLRRLSALLERAQRHQTT